jgi:hypothetical protein
VRSPVEIAGLNPVLPRLQDRWMTTPQLERTSASLVGRERECAAIDRLLEVSMRGESSCLVLRGVARHGQDRTVEARLGGGARRVLRTTGVEVESDLAFAGLYGLLRPICGQAGLAARDAGGPEAGALGLAPSVGWDRLLVSAATLSLLAAGAGETGSSIAVPAPRPASPSGRRW